MKKILIVDDEQDIVESLKFVLEVEDYTCYCAYNGEDGLRLAKEIMPDLIILDVMMPKINGYKISRLLKQQVQKYPDFNGYCKNSGRGQANRRRNWCGRIYYKTV